MVYLEIDNSLKQFLAEKEINFEEINQRIFLSYNTV